MDKRPKKKVVIYGGSFNPPHLGHANVISALLRLFSCDEIWVMPSGERKDKHIGIFGKHRLAMLKIMLKELFPRPKIPIKLSTLELCRPKFTTTYQTLKKLKAHYPSHDFYFYVGSDLLGDIRTKWVNGRKLYDTVHFVSMAEPNSFLPKRLPKHIILLRGKRTGWANTSSTAIRSLIRHRVSRLPGVMRGVAGYINKNKLYR